MGNVPDAKVRRALRALETVPSRPDAAIARVCDALAALDHADACMYYRPVLTVAGLRIATIEVRAPKSRRACFDAFQEHYARLAREMRNLSASYDPSRVRPIERRAFVEFHRVVPDHVFQQTSLYSEVCEPYGIDAQQRMLVFHDEAMLGWIGFIRFRGGPFRRADRRRLRPLVAPVQRVVTAAARAMESVLPEAPGDLVLRPDGRVELASAIGRRWLDATQLADALRIAIRRLDAGAPNDSAVLGLPPCAEARVIRVDGDGAGVRYVVSLRRPDELRISTLGRLTRAEREVAQLVAAGATIRESADMLGKSAETVRSQLARVYRKLDVSSRAELVAALSDA